jgi:hypothetical protein
MALWRKMNNPKLNKHLQNGWIKSIKWFLGYSLLSYFLMILFNLYLMFTENRFEIQYVKPIANKGNYIYGFEGLYNAAFSNATFLDRLLIGLKPNNFSLFSSIFNCLIIWQLLRILNDLSFEKSPFTLEIAKRIRNIAWVLIFTSILFVVKYYYTIWKLSTLEKGAKLNLSLSSIPEIDAFKYGILLFILYRVFIYGCNLQKEQDLTV